MPVTPPVIGSDMRQYGRELNLFLSRNLGKLFFKQSDDIPADNGIFLWDEAKGYPVVSAGGAFRQLALKQATPASNIGVAGNTTGQVAWDTNYFYVCVADYDGTTAIWKRIALTSW